MNDPKALALFHEIFRTTQTRKFPWQTTASEGEFVATMLGKYTVTLFPYTFFNDNGDQVGPPSLSVQDSSGKTVVEINTTVDGVVTEELRDLAILARRTALRSDETIDELLAELKKDDYDEDPF